MKITTEKHLKGIFLKDRQVRPTGRKNTPFGKVGMLSYELSENENDLFDKHYYIFS